VATWPLPWSRRTEAGVFCAMTAVNVTPARFPTVAVIVAVSTTAPAVRRVDAWPCALVVAEAGVTVPALAESTANVTVAPRTGKPSASRTSTVSAGVCSNATTRTVSTVTRVIVAGAPASPVAVKTAGCSPATRASTVFVPGVAPSVTPPAAATPCALVVWVGPVTAAPPAVGANVTLTPATGFPNWSTTRTVGAACSAAAARASWLFPPTTSSRAAGPAWPVTVKRDRLSSPGRPP
jgi:hypothetical protein